MGFVFVARVESLGPMRTHALVHRTSAVVPNLPPGSLFNQRDAAPVIHVRLCATPSHSLQNNPWEAPLTCNGYRQHSTKQFDEW